MKWITILVFAATAAAQERTFVFTSKVEYEGKVVTGAPYSAQAVTETSQVLADGNRITRKSSSFIARDSQGRTRREQNLKDVGPWSSPDNDGGVVFINDPVAGVRYTLQTSSKMAVKLPPGAEGQHVRQELISPNEPRSAPTAESLGTRTIEGVVAEGKRVTETIPPGKIGNERAIEVVNETWFSPELQTVIMSKHSDPRSGDVVYTLSNISRAEPDPSMFTVPQDYKIKEGRIELRRQP